MKRRLAKLAVLLLLGAIVNVAVAWGCAMSCRPIDPERELVSVGTSCTDGMTIWSRPGAERRFVCREMADESYKHDLALMKQRLHGAVMWAVARHAGISREHVPSESLGRTFDSVIYYAIDLCGWPTHSLQCSFAPATTTVHSVSNLRNGLLLAPNKSTTLGRIRRPWLDIRVLPLAPLWPGFAINTIFYAAILWVLFAAPFNVRRWRRIRRGQCAACAYPVGTSETCTECGRPVRAKYVEAVA